MAAHITLHEIGVPFESGAEADERGAAEREQRAIDAALTNTYLPPCGSPPATGMNSLQLC